MLARMNRCKKLQNESTSPRENQIQKPAAVEATPSWTTIWLQAVGCALSLM
jgi:hypothetical protein